MKFLRCYLAQLLVFLILAVTIVSSCKKDPYSIGLELLPASDTLNIKVSDTSTINACSLLQDSIRTDRATTGILGSMLDPIFGKTTASMYTQFRLSTEGPLFGTNPTLDSLVLVLPYKTSYGNLTTIQNIRVYELSEDLHYDSIYYSNHTMQTYPNLLANYSFRPRPKDSVIIGKDTVGPQLRISLTRFTNYLGNKILTAPSSAMATGDAFIAFMKGLYVESTPVNSGGALLSFDFNSAVSKLVLYYHNKEGGDTTQIHFDMPVNSLCSYFNRFDHNKYMDASSDFKKEVLYHDTTVSLNKLFMQGLGGVWTRIRLPYIKNFAKGHHVAIHNALLVVKNYETDTTLNPPPELSIIKMDSTGKISNLIDYDEGAGYYGGTYNKTARTYSFRISRHIQQILLGETKNYDLYIMVNNPTLNVIEPNRVMLNGTKPSLPVLPADRMQLQIIYTKVD